MLLMAWEKIERDRVDFCGIKKSEIFIEKLLAMQWIYLGFYQNRLIGMFAVDAFEHPQCGRVHFWIFKDGLRVALPGCRHCLLWLFDECGFDTLITWTPAGFKQGCALATRLGAILIGVIPDAIVTQRGKEAVTVGYFTRENVYYGNVQSTRCAKGAAAAENARS